MQVALHVGIHGTDDDRINRCLAQNRGLLARHRIEVPPAEINEPILNESLAALKGGTATAEMEAVVLDALLEGDEVARMIVSRPNLIGPARRALDGGGLLGIAGARMRAVAELFPSHGCEFFIALQNPATYLPYALRRREDAPAPIDPEDIRWAPAIRRIAEAIGPRPLVVWCNEDTPLIFPDVVRRLAGLPPEAPLAGDTLMAERVLTDEGTAQLKARLREAGATGPAQRRAITADVLARHHDPEALSTRIDAPGFTEGVVAEMTAFYDEDVAEIAALPGIEFIAP